MVLGQFLAQKKTEGAHYSFPLEHGRTQSPCKTTGVFELQINSQTMPTDMKCKSPGKMVRTMILHFLKSNIKNKLFLFGELGCLSSFTNMLFSLFWFPYIQDREGDSCSPQQRYLKNTGLLGSSRTEVK